MVTHSIEAILRDVITREGGYVNYLNDQGGPTKYGITLHTLQAWRCMEYDPDDPEAEVEVTADDVQALTQAEAFDIYEHMFVDAPGYGGIEDGNLQAQVIDAAILHGPTRATKWLQKVLGVQADGIIGPITRRIVNEHDPAVTGVRFTAARIRAIGRLVTSDPTQAVFAAGWLNRATIFLDGVSI